MADASREPAQLRAYWLGPGLARWATSPHPYEALVSALRKEGVPGHMVHGLAASLYHAHFGKWPGKHGRDAAMNLHPKDRGV